MVYNNCKFNIFSTSISYIAKFTKFHFLSFKIQFTLLSVPEHSERAIKETLDMFKNKKLVKKSVEALTHASWTKQERQLSCHKNSGNKQSHKQSRQYRTQQKSQQAIIGQKQQQSTGCQCSPNQQLHLPTGDHSQMKQRGNKTLVQRC
ncbi:Hypothetical_protein [Hexamita inflata]|uniref:Hypothetical_protein n=1 Tax=Hexamita inflata TaxID=28002 RepID=A0AA86ULL8_9EUKA|nr:Hypothetical protein HINF_LOCUS43757 [Hexamita inflata]